MFFIRLMMSVWQANAQIPGKYRVKMFHHPAAGA